MTQMQADFRGRNAFVTGAGGGMGLQIARDLIAPARRRRSST